MEQPKYPFLIGIYKGEGRILIDPFIKHFGGFYVESGSFLLIENMEDGVTIGDGILKMSEFIKNSSISHITQKEREMNAVWKRNSRYKNWNSFWKNNDYATFRIFEDGHYEVYSAKHSEKYRGNYEGSIKKIILPSTATVEEIGKAVIEVFEAAEEYSSQASANDFYPEKQLQLLDGSALRVKHPSDRHFEDYEDCGAAEIYQCYSYLPREEGEATAEFFLGIAGELDACNLEEGNIKSCWERYYGKAEVFEIQEVEYGIFQLRVEMKNKNTHKISYYLQMEEDLLLECGMDVHQPNRRKKLDEKLSDMFKEFVLSCKWGKTSKD